MTERPEVTFIGVVESAGEVSRVRIFPQFCVGLQRLDNFSHIIILYWLHLRDNAKERSTLQVVPRRHRGAPQVGVFASRSPSRPTPIGMCTVELTKMKNCTLFVKGLDAFEGSPIIDVKPYIPRADSIPEARVPEWTSRGPTT
ncbi:MAG: tRNA (N6-threonylcarbamoyladenosine(37)-N6)-methyltransferase TrmO [Candidatus Bathyarchaeota archaeon]|nr:tRNA (N6-threonylcarbamoyladenosine(37)-N6)-methyltransferase TrmO [Candidatus Bathyarchaeota archaeon]MDH5734256.1 tRNA (N6-threonylcarbamoyladenosine(37)-N6)-methyltransferase TrmO [Candidatus Bathyarchaeota archaeon]